MTINIKIGGNNEKERLRDYNEFVICMLLGTWKIKNI